MGNHPIFTKKTPHEILMKNKHGVLSFQNLYCLYLFHKEPVFKNAISSQNNFLFPDGKPISLAIKSEQIRGPGFTRDFFENKLTKNQKHFFILPNKEDLNKLIKKFPKLKNSGTHFPPYIKEVKFSKNEIKEISSKIKKIKPDYVWIGISSPKQEILANQLYKNYKTIYINIGAALDFLLKKQKEAPKFFIKTGTESAYIGILNPKRALKKVFGSFYALMYLGKIKAE